MRKFCQQLLRLIAPSPKPAARSGLTISDPTAEAEAMIERLLRQRAGA